MLNIFDKQATAEHVALCHSLKHKSKAHYIIYNEAKRHNAIPERVVCRTHKTCHNRNSRQIDLVQKKLITQFRAIKQENKMKVIIEL